MGTPDYKDELTSSEEKSLKGTTRTSTTPYCRDKIEPKEFDPEEAYDREQKRLRQKHYRNQKR